MNWQPISTAPKDNNRPLYLARFSEDGKLQVLDFDGGWEYWQESAELSHINGYAWVSADGIEEPTHWAYQDAGAPPAELVREHRDEPWIAEAFQGASQETIPPMALGHISEWWFRKGAGYATGKGSLQSRITALEAQIASLSGDMHTADKLLSKGDNSGALAHVRCMYMRSTPSYLDAVGRLALRQSVASTQSGTASEDAIPPPQTI